MRKMLTVAAATVALAGCGTVTRGENEKVAIQVQPSNARVTTDIGMRCTGPCVLKVPRNKTFTVTASAPGYAPASVAVGTKVSPEGGLAFMGNAVSAGVIGAIIDAGSGAMKDHYPNPVVLALQPVPAAAARQSRARLPKVAARSATKSKARPAIIRPAAASAAAPADTTPALRRVPESAPSRAFKGGDFPLGEASIR